MTRLSLSLTDFIARIPPAWLETQRWVCWKFEAREGKPTKIPYNPNTGRRAKSDDPKTWSSLSVAFAWHEKHADSAGLGRMFEEGANEVGIDLDHCIEGGVVAPWALDMLSKRTSYAELSPSGTGIKLWVGGPALPKGTRRANYPVEGAAIEMYSHTRFFTVTSERFENCPREVSDATSSVLALYSQLNDRGAKKEALTILPAKSLDDSSIIDKAKAAKNGATFATLWSGDWKTAGFGSQSEADLALCNLLAFYTGPEPSRIDALFRASGLYREKWDREDYGKPTIEKALTGRTEFYGNEYAKREEAAHVASRWTPESIASISEIDTIFSTQSIAELALLKKRDSAAFARVNLALRARFEKAFPVRDFERAVTQAAREIPREAEKKSDLPKIRIGVDILACAKAGEAALGKSGVEVFARGGGIGLVRLIRDPAIPDAEIVREKGTPVIDVVGDSYGRALLSSVARWTYQDEDEEEKFVSPPADICKTVLDLGAWPHVRPLTGIVTAPVLRPDGSILQTPGYDASTGILAEFDGKAFPPVPDNPTQDDAIKALADLAEGFCDFPFIDRDEGTDKSAALAGILSVFARPAIPGCVPLFAWRATTAGTGKSLGVDVISIIASGRIAARMADCEHEDEWRKRLLAVALAGDPITLFDNMMRPLGNGPLALALTAGTISDRILQETKQVTAPFRSVLFATGNGLTFVGDLPRRVVPVDMDAETEHPEQRGGFRYTDLLAWVRANRPRLAVAALTALRAHAVAGRPQTKLCPFGNYEDWTRIVRQCLVWAGWPDPWLTRLRIAQDSDPERDILATILQEWKEGLPPNALPLSEVWSKANDNLKAVLRTVDFRCAPGSQPSLKTLGKWLRIRSKKIVNRLRFVQVLDSHKKQMTWKVEEVEDDSNPANPA